ncbi:MAG: glycosyltransferase family 87 protein [Planctomycetota bacterium]|nr:glycosyltransferase family 87 protein [Planctomycetota bacterium]
MGDLLLRGEDIYDAAPPGINTWPPFFSLLTTPFALLSYLSAQLARAVWLLLNFALFLVVMDLISQRVLGTRLKLRKDGAGTPLSSPLLLVPILLTHRFIIGNFEHLQVNIAIFALTLAGMHWQDTGRVVRGGVAIGLAIAMKVMPVVFVPYLLYRRRFLAATVATLAAAAFSLSPALLFGWDQFVDYVVAWRAAIEPGWGVSTMNQSIFAMWDRFLGHGVTLLTPPMTGHSPASGDPAIPVATVITVAALAAVGLWASLCRKGETLGRLGKTAEWSAVFVAAAICGPVAWKAYMVVFLLPNVLLFAIWRSEDFDPRTRRLAGTTMWLAFALGMLTATGFVGKFIGLRFHMMSAVTLAAITLVVGCLLLRRRLGSR